MYRIAICEDEPALLDNMHNLCSEILAELSYPCKVSDFLNAEELYDKLQKKAVFLICCY